MTSGIYAGTVVSEYNLGSYLTNHTTWFCCNLSNVFLYENSIIPIRISLKFGPRSPIDNKPALVQVLAWRWIGDKPLSELMLPYFTDAYICGTRGRWVKGNSVWAIELDQESYSMICILSWTVWSLLYMQISLNRSHNLLLIVTITVNNANVFHMQIVIYQPKTILLVMVNPYLYHTILSYHMMYRYR